jgi:hypothetical protein
MVLPLRLARPAAAGLDPFAAPLRYRIDGAFVVANAQLPGSQASHSINRRRIPIQSP